jgi:hypothetical protein
MTFGLSGRIEVIHAGFNSPTPAHYSFCVGIFIQGLILVDYRKYRDEINWIQGIQEENCSTFRSTSKNKIESRKANKKCLTKQDAPSKVKPRLADIMSLKIQLPRNNRNHYFPVYEISTFFLGSRCLE